MVALLSSPGGQHSFCHVLPELFLLVLSSWIMPPDITCFGSCSPPSALNKLRQVADWNRHAAPRDRVKRSGHVVTCSNYRADVWMRMPGVWGNRTRMKIFLKHCKLGFQARSDSDSVASETIKEAGSCHFHYAANIMWICHNVFWKMNPISKLFYSQITYNFL